MDICAYEGTYTRQQSSGPGNCHDLLLPQVREKEKVANGVKVLGFSSYFALLFFL